MVHVRRVIASKNSAIIFLMHDSVDRMSMSFSSGSCLRAASSPTSDFLARVKQMGEGYPWMSTHELSFGITYGSKTGMIRRSANRVSTDVNSGIGPRYTSRSSDGKLERGAASASQSERLLILEDEPLKDLLRFFNLPSPFPSACILVFWTDRSG